ncbi:arginase family protein [Bacillus alveayuensis]|jgi:arginase family enzyme|uniref:arginase family protein n=1 Tax=Aeribacillus alveayuensis TaxID=279215 RepID=UPI0005D12C33|nr:arginase family protein [Bacillus alveayuensis]
MGLLHQGVTFLNFDETYFFQQKLYSFPHENIDFLGLSHVHLYCADESLKLIEKKLSNRKQRGITFIGSGNYHYVTYLLLKEIKKPFTLILFDNHLDMDVKMDHQDSMISCGTWVSFALQNIPYLKHVLIVGPTSKAYNFQHQKVTIFSFHKEQNYSPKLILSNIKTDNIYISIDKDVLHKEEAATNWDQGKMKLKTLLSFLEQILVQKRVIGMDICGESPLSHGRFFSASIRKNETANLKVLQTCIRLQERSLA